MKLFFIEKIKEQKKVNGKFVIKKDGKEFIVNVEFRFDFVDNLWCNIIILQDVEEFFEKTWNYMGAEYYEK